MLKNYFYKRKKTVRYEEYLKKENTRTGEELANNEINTILVLLKKFFNFEIKNILKVLDVGCKDKCLRKPFEKKGFFYEGIDVDVVYFNNDKFPLKSNTFVILVYLAVIEHIKNTKNFLNEIYRVLKKWGFIFFSTPNWFYAYKNFSDDHSYVKPFTKRSLYQMLSHFNFKDIHIDPGLRNKYFSQYTMPFAEFFAKILPFMAYFNLAPSFLKVKATSLFALAQK